MKFYLLFLSAILFSCFSGVHNETNLKLQSEDSLSKAIYTFQIPFEMNDVYGNVEKLEQCFFYKDIYLHAKKNIRHNFSNGFSDTSYQYFVYKKNDKKGILFIDSVNVIRNLSVDSFMQKSMIKYAELIIDKILDSSRLLYDIKKENGGVKTYVPIYKGNSSYCDTAYLYYENQTLSRNNHFLLSNKTAGEAIIYAELIYKDKTEEHVNGITNSQRKLRMIVTEQVIKMPKDISSIILAIKTNGWL